MVTPSTTCGLEGCGHPGCHPVRFYGAVKNVFGHIDLLPPSAEAEVEVLLCDVHHQVLRASYSPDTRTP